MESTSGVVDPDLVRTGPVWVAEGGGGGIFGNEAAARAGVGASSVFCGGG